MKQVIVVRADLKCNRGKEEAQCTHAAVYTVVKNFNHPLMKEWLQTGKTCIVVSVDSEQALFDLLNQAKAAGLIHALVTDAGRTQFNGVPTNTCIAIGPAPDDEVDAITGHLKLR
jgi:PTH2 family peptidyl-tRNA hydrolase